jgi:formylglycine-generating enzyme required for sulfatase activity
VSQRKPSVFISYSHNDVEWKNQFVRQLQIPAKHHGFEVWHDGQIQVGDDWRERIGRALESTQIAVLLISDEFLNSEFISTHEVPLLLDLRKQGRVEIVPVLVGACLWQSVDWLERLELRPKGGEPLESLSIPAQKKALVQIAGEIDAKLTTGKRLASAPTTGAGYVEDLGGGVTMEMVAIPGGQFEMGSPEGEAGRYPWEGPQRSVTVAPFLLGKFEVTQAQWRTVAGWPQVARSLEAAPSLFKGDDLPVENVSWEDAAEFCARLSRRSGRAYRLPSEAEWECAARAGTKTATYAGAMEILGENNAPVLDEIAWYGGNSGVGFERSDGVDSSDWPEKQYPHSRAGTRPVGRKTPNAWGLYDMLGNVWEWVEDDWHDSYGGAPVNGKAWAEPTRGSARVVRGGSWNDLAGLVRAACRDCPAPDARRGALGFRCARVQE